MSSTKQPVDYHEVRTSGGVPFVVLNYRDSRFPIKKTVVTASGTVELHGADGMVEVLGSLQAPCSVPILKRLRVHHEGLLLVQVKPNTLDGAISEQVVSARFFA